MLQVIGPAREMEFDSAGNLVDAIAPFGGAGGAEHVPDSNISA
jgi:hypothetical protein